MDNLAKELQKTAEKFMKIPRFPDHHRKTEFKRGELILAAHLYSAFGEGKTGLTPSVLAEKMQASAPSISFIISNMEKRNIVERKLLKEDKRSVYIFLTAKGKSLYEEHLAHQFEDMKWIAQKLGAEKTKNLNRALNDLAQVLKERE